jgi:hypothetical protein
LLQAVQDGQLQAFQLVKQLGGEVCSSLAPALVQYVVSNGSSSRQQGGPAKDHNKQQPRGSLAPHAEGSHGKYSSSNSREWCAAVEALAAIWPASCHLLDPEMVVEVLQAVVPGVMEYHQLYPCSWSWEQRQLTPSFVKLLQGVRSHAGRLTSVLQSSSLMRELAAVVAVTGTTEVAKCMAGLVAASVVPLRQLPAAHAVVCELLSSGLQQGAHLLSVLTPPDVQQRLGVWQDPALQAACLEGARRAAAALASVAASNESPDSVGASSSSMYVAAAGMGMDARLVRERACQACCAYAEHLVCLIEGQQSAQVPVDAATSRQLAAAAWQCVVQPLLAPRSFYESAIQSSWAWRAAQKLLCSPAACQVLQQQPGGLCSLEEMCSMLVQGLELRCCHDAVQAVVSFLSDPALREAVLAVPGFAASVVKHVLGSVDNRTARVSLKASEVEPLLGRLVCDSNGRAALLAEPDILGLLAWHAAKCAWLDPSSPHLAQLWAEGDDVAARMVAGLAAGDQAWVRFFGWMVRHRPTAEWGELEGLPGALAGAFDRDLFNDMECTLWQVLRWWLKKGEGRLLLSDNEVLSAALSCWLQRHTSRGAESPLVVLIKDAWEGGPNHPDIVAAASWLGRSPVLCKGAVVSLLTYCRWAHDESDKQGDLVGRLVRQQLTQREVEVGRDLLCILLRAAAYDWHTARNPVAMRALKQLPVECLLPILLQLLGEAPAVIPAPAAAGPPGSGSGQQPSTPAAVAAGVVAGGAGAAVSGPSGTSAAAAAAGGSSAAPAAIDIKVLLGAWRALEQIQSDSTKGQQQVFRTLGQLVLDAARVQELQQVEAAGHVACVAAAQARQQLAAKQQQLEQERESIRQEQQQLEQQRAELAAERQRMQLERESLQAERQQLQLLRAQVDRSGQRKRRHL